MPGTPERWQLVHRFSHQGLGHPSARMQLFLHVAGAGAGSPCCGAWPLGAPTGLPSPTLVPRLRRLMLRLTERPASVSGAGLQESPQTRLQLYVFK